MFSSEIPTFVIDLDKAEATRWSSVIASCREPALKLLAEAGHELRYVPQLVQKLFAWLYGFRGGMFTGEIAALAKGFGISPGTATVLNCAYELSHLHFPKLLGCTAGVRFVEGQGMVHVRTLDWPLPAMGPATCLFRFRKGAREFVAVGVPGQVGVLSGMVPGAYSVTINWAPPGRNPNFNWGPTFFLRHVLSTCDTYAQAVAALRDTPLSTSVFFTVCGAKPGEACVIERAQYKAIVRKPADGVLVQANHHEAQCFVRNNARIAEMESAEFMVESGDRAIQLTQALAAFNSAVHPVSVLDQKPVCNPDTVQKMVFYPAAGKVEIWKRVSA
jgi:predicted choloylglycine hydrolase